MKLFSFLNKFKINKDSALDKAIAFEIYDIANGFLFLSLVRQYHRIEDLPSKAKDNWSLGYIFGTVDAYRQQYQASNVEFESRPVEIAMTSIYKRRLGDSSLYTVSLNLWKDGNSDFAKGMVAGGSEVMTSLNDPKYTIKGWAMHIAGKDLPRNTTEP